MKVTLTPNQHKSLKQILSAETASLEESVLGIQEELEYRAKHYGPHGLDSSHLALHGWENELANLKELLEAVNKAETE